MTNLTNFDLKLIVLFKLLTKGHNGMEKCTEVDWNSLHTTLYQYISPDPKIKFVQLLEKGLASIHTNYREKKLFERSKVKA